MAWVRLDDNFPDHPKLQKVGVLGLAAQVKALCYCARFLTDGRIPHEVIQDILRTVKPLTAHQMVAAGLWVKRAKFYFIHDYLLYQPDRATVLKLRSQRAEYGRRGGIAKSVADATARAMAREAMAQQGAKADASIPAFPNPAPPPPLTSKPRTIARATEEPIPIAIALQDTIASIEARRPELTGES